MPEPAPLVPAPDQWLAPFPPTDLQLAYLGGESAGVEHPVRAKLYVEYGLAAGLDPARLEAAINRALQRQRHNLVVLRPDGLLQVPARFTPLRLLAVHDLRGRGEAATAQALREIREPLQRRVLPLDRWPWIEFRACQLDGETRLLVNTANHFVDAITFRGLMADLQRFYAQPDAAPPPPSISFRDCVLAYRQIEASASGQASERYWRERIAQLPHAPALPQRPGIDPGTPSRLVRREATVQAPRWAAFRRTAARLGVSAGVALYGVYAQVLAAWSGSRHFLLAHMTSFRPHLPHPEAAEIAGGFGAVYPMEIDLREPRPLREQLQRLQGQVLRDAQHQHWGGGRVWQALAQARKTAGRAAAPFVVVSGLDLPPWDRPFHACLETPQVLFDHQFWNLSDGRLWLVLDANEQHFPPGLVDAFWEAYQALVLQLGEDEPAWERPHFDLLPAAQRASRAAANATAADVPTGLLQQLLQGAADRWPDQPALITSERRVSWRGLQAWANRLSHRLREAGVGRAMPVVVALERGAGQVAAVHGVLGAGGAYVPVDPAWPAERIAFVLRDTGARCVVTSLATRATLALPPQLPCVCVDDPALDEQPATPLPALQQPDDLAYVIYTSGSTGQPKGVMIDHRAALNTVLDINRRFGITQRDVVYGVSALSFDLSVYDLFGSAAAGAALVLPSSAEAQQPGAWIEAVQRHGVTVWNSVPALMQLLADAAHIGGQTLPSLKTVMLSGDWIPVTLPGQARRSVPHAAWHSLGGATEAAIWSIAYPIERVDPAWTSIPYGKPLANQRWHVLADDGTDAPDWVPGHLHIAGLGLAQGYWGDEEKTARAFVRHPRTGERLYRTGDLGRYLPDGTLEFLGRADHQVKIQGHRIELGEIEHALLTHPAVHAAAVLAVGERTGRRLVGFCAVAPGQGVDSAALQAHLRARLPAHMVPPQFHCLPALPLSANGKVDRAALQERAQAQAQAQALAPAADAPAADDAPRTPLERQLAQIWQEVLGLPSVGVHDDFFELGGQSFAGIQVMTRIAQQLGRRLPLGELLRGRTIAHLARSIEQAARWSPLVRIREIDAGGEGEAGGAGGAADAAGAAGADGAGAPLFLVHPAGGNVLCYWALAQRLNRPVHGLQAAGLDGEREPLAELPAMAALYLQALREAQPQGPYHLGAWSSGGLVAFEMARQLEAAGETVRQLVLVDTPAPWPSSLAATDVDESTLLRWFVQDMTPAAAAAARTRRCDSLAEAVALIDEHRRDADPLPLAQVEPVWRVFRAMLKATQAYRGGRVRAAITVAKAAEQRVDEFARHPDRHAPDWGWSRFTDGGVQPLAVPGDHHAMWQGAGLDLLASLFQAPAPAAAPDAA
jgi:amino acid adenylation domain-containing protein